MKKIYFLLIGFFLFNFMIVDAATCNSSELTKLNEVANKIKVSEEIIEKKVTLQTEPGEGDYGPEGAKEPESYEDVVSSIKITLYNLTNDVYVIQTDANSDDKKVIYYKDTKDGNYVIETDDVYAKNTYTFEVYSNTSCDTTKLKTITYVKPWINPNYSLEICKEHEQDAMCQKFIKEEPKVTDIDINSYFNKNDDTKEDNQDNKKSFIIANKEYFIIGGAVVLIGALTAVLIIRKKRSEL